MRFLALVSGIVYILLSRPTSERPPLAALPAPATPPTLQPRLDHVRAGRENFVHELLEQAEPEIEHMHRRKDDLVPLHQAYELLKDVAVELVDDSRDSSWPDLQPDVDFAYKLAIIISTIKQHFGLHVEPASIGAQLFRALESEDFCTVADMRATILNDTRGVSEEDKSHYLFFLFWPERYSQFMRGVH